MAHPFPSRTAHDDAAATRLRAVTGAFDPRAGDDPAYRDPTDGWPWQLDVAADPAAGIAADAAPGASTSSRRSIARLRSASAAWWAFLDSGRRGVAAVVVVGVLAALVATVGFLRARPSAVPVAGVGTGSAAVAVAQTPEGRTAGAPPTSAAGAALGALGPSTAVPGAGGSGAAGSGAAMPNATSTVLVVDVAGKVRHPGIVRLPLGARVDDAVQAAGGPLPGVRLGLLNLASPLTDGEQVVVGLRVGPSGLGLGAGTSAGGVSAGVGDGSGGAAPVPGTSPSAAPVDVNTATAAQLETLPRVGPVLAQRIIDFRTSHGAFRSVDELEQVPGIGPSTMADLRGLVTV